MPAMAKSRHMFDCNRDVADLPKCSRAAVETPPRDLTAFGAGSRLERANRSTGCGHPDRLTRIAGCSPRYDHSRTCYKTFAFSRPVLNGDMENHFSHPSKMRPSTVSSKRHLATSPSNEPYGYCSYTTDHGYHFPFPS